MLTAGSDVKTGTEKGDVFKADSFFNADGKYYPTLNSNDELDGGAGKDTLNITDETAAYTMATATIKNIETITIKGAGSVTADVSGTNVTGLESIAVTKAFQAVDTTAVKITAAATTDVNVSGVTLATNANPTKLIDITGGKTVTVNQALTDEFSRIDIDKAVDVKVTATDLVNTNTAASAGAVNAVNVTGATGTVDVTTSGAKIVGGTGAITLNDVNVSGGTTVAVTQKATLDMGDIATKGTATDVVTQGAVTIVATAATTDVTVKQDAAQTGKVAAFTTGAVTETASVKFGALTSGETVILGGLTLKANAAMTATEVAAAFANLAANAALPTGATGDTQSAGAYAKATYTGSISGWTSGAATGDTVVFTSTANGPVANLVDGGTAVTDVAITTTDGKSNDATKAGGELAIAAGVVDITADTALTTVTVDSYGVGSKIQGLTNTALATINLKNGGAFTVSDTADTVTLTLEKVTGATTFTATAEPKTLNVKSIGDNTGVVANANTTAFNVSGTGTLTQTGSLAAVKNITVTETAGLNLTSATLTALESIDATATNGAVTASISGTQTTYAGSKGVDTVTVSNASTKIAKAIDLGAGDDKLILAGGTVLVPTAELKGGADTDTLSIDATSAALLDDDTAFAAKLNSFERLELTTVSTQDINVKNLGFANYVTVNGTTGAATLSNLANNATVVINKAVGANSVTAVIEGSTEGEADVLNVEITHDDTTAFGTLNADKIETVNLTVTDSNVTSTVPQDAVHTMTLAADKATTLTVDGNAGLTLAFATANVTDLLATIDATDMTAALSVDLTAHNGVAMTVNAGSGADVLKASVGVDAKADILNGGNGNDTLYAGSNGAKLTGGAGNDLFILTASSAATGTKNALTATEITDFKAGDLLQLEYYNAATAVNVTGFAKLTAVMNPTESTLNDYVKAAITQANVGEAVWFTKGNDSYVVIDSGTDSATAFVDTQDMIIQLTGVSLTNASFNAQFATVSL